MTDSTNDITVGRIGRAHGIKGEVLVQPWTDSPEERFAAGVRLRTEPADKGPLLVEASKVHSGKLVLKFAGVDTRNAVEQLRGTMLVIDAASRPPIEDPDEFYDTDLVGLAARDLTGIEVGRVSDVLHSAGGSVLVIDAPDGRELLIPFRLPMVPVVDLSGGFLVVDPPDGLFDL